MTSSPCLITVVVPTSRQGLQQDRIWGGGVAEEMWVEDGHSEWPRAKFWGAVGSWAPCCCYLLEGLVAGFHFRLTLPAILLPLEGLGQGWFHGW